LVSLNCILDLTSASSAKYLWPPKLRHLNLSLGAGASAPNVNVALEALSAQLPLLDSFSLTLSRQEPLVSFASLRLLTSLTRLDVSWPMMLLEPPSDAQVDDIRALGHHLTLHHFTFGRGTPPAAVMCHLLQSPPALHHLRSLCSGSGMELNTELGRLLPSLPLLTCLDMTLLPDCDGSFLTLLPTLVDLDLKLSKIVDTASLDSLAESLQRCAQITRLNLKSCRFTPGQMIVLLSGFNDLRALTFYDSKEITSLRFLTCGPITRTLTSLRLEFCKHASLRSSELVCVQALQSLKELVVAVCFAPEVLDAATKALYTPPSALMPALVKFSYWN
jgi:hypothetical protein